MRIIFFVFLILFVFNYFVSTSSAAQDLSGRILLQVEKNGEAWYFEPESRELLFLGRPNDAFQVMRQYGLGVSEFDFQRIRNNPTSALLGRIILQVEKNGEAWYINPLSRKLYFLGRPADAFSLMRELGLGISEKDFSALQLKNNEFDSQKIIPFTSQAPLAEWSNPRFQDACEEASVLMAAAWLNDFSFDQYEAETLILDLSRFAGESLGEWRDQSISDTALLLEKYYGHKNYKVKEADIEEMIRDLKKGSVVIAPFDGRNLNNPYFTPPGPIHHMMLLHSYDEAKQEFVVHDPGTRHGENYRYAKSVIEAAWRDYPTGYHTEFETISKKMLVIDK